jgi:AbrB family looped-hinge helix DNA binding protein
MKYGKDICHLPFKNGIFRFMDRDTLTIDDAGRLVLPKRVRKLFNLASGDKLRISADDKGIHLEPVSPMGQLVRDGTMLIFRGEFSEPITTELVQRLLDEDRSKLAGEDQFKATKENRKK